MTKRNTKSRKSTVKVAAAKTPAVRERLQTMGAQVAPDDHLTPEYLGKFVRSEIDKWAVPIKASGVSAD